MCCTGTPKASPVAPIKKPMQSTIKGSQPEGVTPFSITPEMKRQLILNQQLAKIPKK